MKVLILILLLINLWPIEGSINGIQSELLKSITQNRFARSTSTASHKTKIRRNIFFSPPKKLFEGARLYHNTIIIPKRKITKN